MYLSSYLWGNKPEKIAELIGGGKKHAALITNSADQFPESGIVERLKQDQDFLQSMDISSERLDLREYFGDKKPQLADQLGKFGLIWIRGANVFMLRRALQQSGCDILLTDMLNRDKIVYGGYSAGACVMGSTLRGLELVDDAYIAPKGYNPEPIWDGLGILPYAIAPHFKSDHPETELVDNAIAYFEEHGITYKAIRDGEAIVVNGDNESLIS